MYRLRNTNLEVFLIHPGGPFWTNKDLGAWSIPKGEYDGDEAALDAAKREFVEETGFQPTGDVIELGEIRQPGGKFVKAWAFEGNCDPKDLRSNTFTLEWPPRSGRIVEFPEVDRGAWYSLEDARRYVSAAQQPFLERLIRARGAK